MTKVHYILLNIHAIVFGCTHTHTHTHTHIYNAQEETKMKFSCISKLNKKEGKKRSVCKQWSCNSCYEHLEN